MKSSTASNPTATTLTQNPKATRVAFGEALLELADQYPHLVVLDADLSKSTMTGSFAKKYPQRHLQMGIAEANMIGTGAGLALAGKIPVITSFACFIVGRFETIRVSVAYNNANVKIIGTHAGLGIGEDGYTQMALEDLACLRSFPNFVLLQPADEIETKQALAWALSHKGPVYLRLTRQPLEPIHEPSSYRFTMGQAEELRAGSKAAILATGSCVKNALLAADILSKQGISVGVANFATIQPIDGDFIAQLASKAKLLVTCEDHALCGGLGSAVSEVLAEKGASARLIRIAAKGFGESGASSELYKKHGLDSESIAKSTLFALQ